MCRIGAVIERDAGSAQHVAAIACNIERGADVVPLRERNLRARGSAELLELRETPRDELSAGELANGVREPRLDQLRVAQRAAEELARLRVLQHRIDAGARGAASAPRDSEPRIVEALQRRFQPVRFGQAARFRELARRSNASSAVLDARNDSLFLMTRDSNPSAPFSTRNALTPSSVAAQTTATSASAPFVIQCFAPSSAQSAPLPARARAHARGIRAAVRLGQREATELLAARERRQPSRALLLRAERMDRTHDETALHGNAAAHAAVAALELLANEAVRDSSRARRSRTRAAWRRTVRARRGAERARSGNAPPRSSPR